MQTMNNVSAHDAVLLWAYTIIGAFVVNALKGSVFNC
jgi:hypothetical protein